MSWQDKLHDKKGKFMFDKLKQLKQLKDLQSALAQEKFDAEKEGIKITINGKLEIELLQLNPSLEKEKQEKFLKDLINETIRKMQLKLAQKMSQMPGLKF
ncbi:MAG: hypothetical protein A2297_04240 [Elusimicrobia bacterium RIFOXYB2_FULL_48_7]|nr:MAG: hypothetical protein A2297_04240 [Elusimicrobia bacterium RIFOXYB2_FULL_48_7]